jgi:NAD(P)-dependent dehydrogenase (short-subunit alcohol dehydrogenase family)
MGKRILITGATSGIGKETAIALAEDKENEIIFIARNQEKAQNTLIEIKNKTGNDKIHFIISDLSLLKNAKSAAEEYKSRFDSLDILINNAGFVAGEKIITAEGLEETLAVNHFSHFLLTNILLDTIKRSGNGRIIHISSGAHKAIKNIDFTDLNFDKTVFKYFLVYGLSKLFNILFSNQLAKRLNGSGVTSNALHPGVINSNFGHSSKSSIKIAMKLISPFIKNSRQGAQTTIYLATSKNVEGITGKYFVNNKLAEPSPLAKDENMEEKLWQISENICKKYYE